MPSETEKSTVSEGEVLVVRARMDDQLEVAQSAVRYCSTNDEIDCPPLSYPARDRLRAAREFLRSPRSRAAPDKPR